MGDQLAPGFRFYPTEEELITFYLLNKLEGKIPDMELVVPVVDIYELEPWHLPGVSGELCQKDTEQWFYFAPRQQRETRGGRPNRTTPTGYWKATGSPGHVFSGDNRVIGVKKTMVFYKGKAPTGSKTKWKMNEYKAIEECTTTTSSAPIPKLRHEFSLCRVYVISGTTRAFDRRPSTLANPQGNGDHVIAMNSQNIEMFGASISSPERSNSLGKTQVDEQQDIEETSNNIESSIVEPQWSWEQMDWL